MKQKELEGKGEKEWLQLTNFYIPEWDRIRAVFLFVFTPKIKVCFSQAEPLPFFLIPINYIQKRSTDKNPYFTSTEI